MLNWTHLIQKNERHPYGRLGKKRRTKSLLFRETTKVLKNIMKIDLYTMKNIKLRNWFC